MDKFEVKKEFEISYAHRLFNYKGKCGNLHGHNAKIEIIIASRRLNKKDMVKDFTIISKVAGKWLEKKIDHATILHKDDPIVKDLIKHKQKIFLLNKNPTAEMIALEIKNALKKSGLNISAVRFWETSTSMAEVKEE